MEMETNRGEGIWGFRVAKLFFRTFFEVRVIEVFFPYGLPTFSGRDNYKSVVFDG